MRSSFRTIDMAFLLVLGIIAVAFGIATVAMSNPNLMMITLLAALTGFVFAFVRSRGGAQPV